MSIAWKIKDNVKLKYRDLIKHIKKHYATKEVVKNTFKFEDGSILWVDESGPVIICPECLKPYDDTFWEFCQC